MVRGVLTWKRPKNFAFLTIYGETAFFSIESRLIVNFSEKWIYRTEMTSSDLNIKYLV